MSSIDLYNSLQETPEIFGVNNMDAAYNDLLGLSCKVPKCGILKLYVRSDDAELVSLYRQHVKEHNESIIQSYYPNSGFDIFIPQDTEFKQANITKMIDLGIKTEMFCFDVETRRLTSSPFLVHPRSSISKTQLMLSNHTGIIDSGYRGFLMAAFRWLNDPVLGHPSYPLQKHTRLLQICMPNLDPILVYLVETESELSTTERGVGGFGSTGIIGIQATR